MLLDKVPSSTPLLSHFIDSSYLQLSESEATAGAHTAVVLDGRASDNGLELVDGAGGDGGSLGLTSGAS